MDNQNQQVTPEEAVRCGAKAADASSDVILEATGLCKHFPVHNFFGRTKQVVRAVDGIDLAIRRGETFGLVGESGCGKSTLGRTLIRMYEPTSGKIVFDGHDITSAHGRELVDIHRKMQIIFQDPYMSLDPHMNVRQIIAEPMRVGAKLTDDEIDSRVAELLVNVGMRPDDMYKFAYEFSGGQRQRVGIARALAVDPEFIVCDEPVSALDVSIQAQVVNMFEDLQQEMGLTYLFIAHDLSVVKHISNRIGVMYLGKMVELADSFELIAHSVHPYTRSLISAIPVADPVTARQSHRIVLQGDVPSPLNPPSGCRFRTRCPYADERCAAEVPEFKEVSSGHWAACHHLDKVK